MTFEIGFGILVKQLEVSLPLVRISPRPDFTKTTDQFKHDLHRDGFFYPSPIHQVRFPDWPDETRTEPVPNTSRPAHLFILPSSHTLTLSDPLGETPARDDASFLVHLLAYVYGTRLQVEGWQFDGRIPVSHPTHHVWAGPAAVTRFIEYAYNEWRSQPAERRLRLTNILYMHSRAPSYDWPWERFLFEYLVTDAIYDYCRRTGLTVPVSHEERIRELCGRLGVWCPTEAPVNALVQMRNTLLHEALWEDERPGYAISAEHYYRVFELRALNQRLIAAIMGGASEYAAIEWTEWRQLLEFR